VDAPERDAIAQRVLASLDPALHSQAWVPALESALEWRRTHYPDAVLQELHRQWMEALSALWPVLAGVGRIHGAFGPDLDDVLQDAFLKLQSGNLHGDPRKMTELLLQPGKLSAYASQTVRTMVVDFHNQASLTRRRFEGISDGAAADYDSAESRDLLNQLPEPSPGVLDRMLAAESRLQRPGQLRKSESQGATMLRDLLSGGGRSLVAVLLAEGSRWGQCDSPIDAALWIRRYAFSDFPPGFPLKRKQITRALVLRKAAGLGIDAEANHAEFARIRKALDLANRRLKETLRALIEDEFGRPPIEKRRPNRKPLKAPSDSRVA
jgi:hypothetical protein